MSAQSGRTDTARALLPLRRSTIDLDDLLDAIDYSLTREPLTGVTVTIEDRLGVDPQILVAEAERVTRVPAAELARDMEFARVPNRRYDLARSFRNWLGQRPVPDAVAAQEGLVVPDWSDEAERTARWTVVVPRSHGTFAEWVPSYQTGPDQIRRIRDDAWARAARLAVEPLRAGDVTVWMYPDNPGLSTCVLTQPDRLATRDADQEDLHVVFSPGRPVVCAGKAAAVRLTEETSEPHLMIPVGTIDAIGWN